MISIGKENDKTLAFKKTNDNYKKNYNFNKNLLKTKNVPADK